ncbi:MAG: biopolymer transporter ExbD [Salinisphaeraceae bacterium]|jgi:biopolymer transport protein ExbD|nr:biopolymer transporter ExbD [Salinisphaeraceae bacterium]
MRRRRSIDADESEESEINMTPMLDIVFIMLIFFIVTTSFVKESGITVDQPTAATTEQRESNNILIGLNPAGEVWIDRRAVDVRAVRATVERLKAETPDAAVIIQADEQAPSGLLVRVMDQVRLAGIDDMAIAAKPE